MLTLKENKAHFTYGANGNVQLKSNIPIGAKVEISPKGTRALHYKSSLK
jgi:hypothetical protein